MKGKLKTVTLILMMSLFFLVACVGDTEIKNVVTAYNRQLIEALSLGRAGLLEFYASPREISRVDAYILYLKKDGKLLVSDIISFEFLKVEKKSETAKIWTKEEWVYHLIDMKSRKPLTKEETIGYRNVYTLIKQGGTWVVDKVDAKEEFYKGMKND